MWVRLLPKLPLSRRGVQAPYCQLLLRTRRTIHARDGRQHRFQRFSDNVLGQDAYFGATRQEQSENKKHLKRLLKNWGEEEKLIHPASRGVAAHTAGLFRSVRGAKGGVEYEEQSSTGELTYITAGEFSLFPPVEASQAREFSLFPPIEASQARIFTFPPRGLPKLRIFTFPPRGGSPS